MKKAQVFMPFKKKKRSFLATAASDSFVVFNICVKIYIAIAITSLWFGVKLLSTDNLRYILKSDLD